MTPTPGQPLSEADRGPAGAVMDALWPLLGGSHTSADLWHEINDAVSEALSPHAPVSRPGDGVEGGWIVSNGNDDRWRAWDQGNPIWVDDPTKATRYARREDAEAVHTEDEDAWCVKPYTNSASDVGEMIRHVCDFQVDSKSGISICTEPTCRKVQRKRGRGMCPSCARGEVRHFSTDDGFWLEIECSAGGANEHGLNGWFSTIEHHPDGSTKRREYVATDSPAYPALTPPSQPVSRPGDGVEDSRYSDEQIKAACVAFLRAEGSDPFNVLYRGAWCGSFPHQTGPERWTFKVEAMKAALEAALTPPAEPVSRPAGEGEREAVARIIDPLRWRRFDRHPPYADHVPRETQIEWSAALQDSLTKADAIIALLSPAAPDAGWRSVKDAPQDGTAILLNHRVHGVIQGWFSRGEWTDDTPISPREYTGDMWVLGDDLAQDEVEFGEHGEVLEGSVMGWLPLSALPGGER